MKEKVIDIVKEYLNIFPDEEERQTNLLAFLQNSTDSEIVDWNNFKGHLVVGGFIYALEDKKFLILHHKDLDMFLYPGGHVDSTDDTLLTAVKREIQEETGLKNVVERKLTKDELVPFDIDTQEIEYNKRLNLPSHTHYDFRYFFTVSHIADIKMDLEEHSSYKWVTAEVFFKRPSYLKLQPKIMNLLNKKRELK